MALFRFCTGEGLPQFMYDASFDRSGCLDVPVYDSSYCGFNDIPGCIPLNGCGSTYIYPYFMSFTLIVTFCILNLFIGIVIDGFKEANDSKKTVKPDDIINFSNHWSNFDLNATRFITMDDLEIFVLSLPAPLGMYLNILL